MTPRPPPDPMDALVQRSPTGWRGALLRLGARRAVVLITLLSVLLSVSFTLGVSLLRGVAGIPWADLSIAITVPAIVAPLAASMILTLLHELEASRRALHELAVRDGLTQLHNRRFFMARLQDEVVRAQRERLPLSVCMIDVDHFKRINDRHGHATGDAVLVRLAGVLVASLRPYDISARYGGEEFVAVLPGASLREAEPAAQRLRRAIEELRVPELAGTSPPHVTASLGLSELAPGETDATALLSRADEALYAAKTGGRNRCVSRPAAEAGQPGDAVVPGATGVPVRPLRMVAGRHDREEGRGLPG